MENFFFRMVAVCAIAFFQAYVFASFPFGGQVVGFGLMAAVAWTIISGFEKIWVYILGLGVLIDLLAFDRVGENVIIFMLAIYSVSFVSKRLLLASAGWSFLLVILLIVAVTFFSNFLALGFSLFQSGSVNFARGEFMNFAVGSFRESLWNIPFFYFLYWAINQLEKRLLFYEKAVNIR